VRYNDRVGEVDATSTYSQILQAIKTSDDGASVRELCQQLELSPMSVRRQLSLLEAEGAVYAEKVKMKTGRPVFRYYLTREGHNKFPRDYAAAAVALLVHLRDIDGKGKVAELFESAANSQIAEHKPRVLGNTLEARVHEVTELLKEKGYECHDLGAETARGAHRVRRRGGHTLGSPDVLGSRPDSA